MLRPGSMARQLGPGWPKRRGSRSRMVAEHPHSSGPRLVWFESALNQGLEEPV